MNTPIRSLWPGKFRALVINDRDPQFKGRVKVRIPDLMVADKKHVGEWGKNGLWASPANNYLGGRTIQDTKIRFKGEDAFYQGSCLIPPKGSHVWVWFEKNDPSHPMYDFAAEYGDVQTLPENQLGRQYQKKWTLLKTKEGRAIVASDDPDDCRMEITGKKRKLKDPPFGDIESVYPIIGNQTTFLIDERENHEKVLLADYRGNYIKLIQNELAGNRQLQDQLHINVNSDTHFHCGGNFYLTVDGELHIQVKGDMYLTCFSNMFVKAYLAYKEMATSFDRASTAYDKTQTTFYDVAAGGSLTLQSATTLYMAAVKCARNAVSISDIGAMSASIMAGGSATMIAGGTAIVYGASGVSIQTDPVGAPISGSVSFPTLPKSCTPCNPDGQRYDEIHLAPGAPVLTTPVGESQLGPVDVNHTSVQTEQKATTEPGNKSKNNTSSEAENQSGNSTVNNSSGGSDNGSSNSSNENNQEGEKKTSFSDWLKSLFSSQTWKSITDSVYAETKSEYFYYSANQVRLNGLNLFAEFSSWLSNSASSLVIGYQFDNSYDIDTVWDSLFDTGMLYYDTQWLDDVQYTCDNLTTSLIRSNRYYNRYSSDYIKKLCDNVNSEYQYFKNDFCDRLRENSINLPDHLNSYETIINDKIFLCLEDVIDARTKGVSISDVIHTSIGDLSLEICNALITLVLGECDKSIDDISNEISETVDTNLQESGQEFLKSVSEIANNSIDSDRDLLSQEINEKSLISSRVPLISEADVANILKIVKEDIAELRDSLHNPTEMVDNPDLVNNRVNEKIDKFLNIIDSKILDEDRTKEALSQFRNQVSTSIENSLPQVFNDSHLDYNVFSPVLDKIKNEFDTTTYSAISSYNDFKQNVSQIYADKVKDLLITKHSDIIQDIIDINQSSDSPSKKSKDTKDKITILFNAIQDTLCGTDCSEYMESRELIESEIDKFKNSLDDVLPTSNNETISQIIDDSINDIVNSADSEKRKSITDTFKLVSQEEGKFSKFYNKTFTSPYKIGCGFDDLLFLNDKYRKTILPLISISGANVVSFTLLKNTVDIQTSVLIDKDCIDQYNKMVSDLSSIDENNKWWDNLKEILEQCSILNITPVITIMDFNDSENPFIRDEKSSTIYTDKNWKDDKQGLFLKTLFNIASRYEIKPIYNIGYGHYKNPIDPNNSKYTIYPTCGYMRQLINWCVYECGISSNYLCLTCNSDGNLYYYNPYTEWHSFDNLQSNTELKEHDVLLKDNIDGFINDNAPVVTYDSDDEIYGGYAGYIIKCHKHSIPIFTMSDILEKVSESQLDISDPNIMNDIFCKKSRDAIRYLKTDSYFESDGRIQFDANGDVL